MLWQGLGLYIAKGIAELHKGHLYVSSKGHGHGTTFTMVLPLHRAPESAIPEHLRKRQQMEFGSIGAGDTTSGDESALEKLRILVVDDTQLNRKLLVRLLERRGHTCEQAEDGLQGLEMVKTSMNAGNPYDSILLDYE